MQATGSFKGFVVNRMHVGLIAAGLLASTLTAAGAITLSHNSSHSVAAPSGAPAVVQSSTWRFQEANQLPSAAAAPGFQHVRFLEANQLPVSAVTTYSFQRARFLEANQLPMAATPLRNVNYRFIESNQLPDDEIELVAPALSRGARS